MNTHLRRLIQIAVVASSLSLLAGYSWFTQQNATQKPSATPLEVPQGQIIDISDQLSVSEFESFINYGKIITTSSGGQTLMLGSKNMSQPIFSTRSPATSLPTPDQQTLTPGSNPGLFTLPLHSPGNTNVFMSSSKSGILKEPWAKLKSTATPESSPAASPPPNPDQPPSPPPP